MKQQAWHAMDVQAVREQVESTPQGLSQQQAQQRLAEGANELVHKKGKSTWALFLDQMKDFMILVLLVAALIK